MTNRSAHSNIDQLTRFLCGAGLSVCALSSFARADVIDIRTAVDTAIKKNPTVMEDREKLIEGQANIKATFATVLPTLSATATAQELKADTLTAPGAFNGDPYNQYNFLFTLTQPIAARGLLTGLQLPYRDMRLREIQVEIDSRNLVGTVISNFYQVVLNERLLALLEMDKKIQTEALAITQHRMRIGRSQLIDVLQAKTNIALIEPKIAAAKNTLQLSAAVLATTMGEPDMKEVRINGTLNPLPEPKIMEQVKDKTPRLPEIEQNATQIQQMAEEKITNQAQHFPVLSAVGTFGRTAFQKSDLFDPYSNLWTVGLQLSVPIFSGLSSVYQNRAFDSRVAQLEVERTNVQNNLSLAQVQGQKNLDTAADTVEFSRIAAELSEQTYVEALRNFRLATIDYLQMLTVEQSYIDSTSAWEQSKYNYLNAMATFYSASGYPMSDLVDLLSKSERKSK